MDYGLWTWDYGLSHNGAMAPPGPDIGRHFNRAWEATKKNFGTFLGAMIVGGLLGIVTCGIMWPAMIAAQYILYARAIRGERVRIGDLFNIANGHYLRMFVAMLLFLIIQI